MGYPLALAVRRPPGAQFSEIRPSRIQLARARAAARRARGLRRWRPQRDHAQGLPAWPDDGRCLPCRDVVLDHAGHGPLRRSAGVGRGHSQRGARRVPRTLSCRVCGRDAPRPCRIRGTGACGCTARVGGDRAGTHAYPDRLSVGAAGVQPGGSAADCATREPVWRLRCVGARRDHQRRGGALGRGAAGRRSPAADGHRRHPDPDRRSVGQPPRVGRRVDARGRPDSRRTDPGEHRPGAEVGSGPRRVHLPELSGDDAAGHRPRRQARAVARVVDAVLFR